MSLPALRKVGRYVREAATGIAGQLRDIRSSGAKGQPPTCHGFIDDVLWRQMYTFMIGCLQL